MSSNAQSSFRWRTLIELSAIALAIYVFFLGAPGLNDVLSSNGKKNIVAPKAQRTSTENLVYPDPQLKCDEPGYRVHVYSTKPRVIYIDGFLSDAEADELVQLR